MTSFLLAPFTRFQEDSGHGLAQWVAATLVAGLAITPRATRAVAAVSTIFGLSDVVQMTYSKLEQSS